MKKNSVLLLLVAAMLMVIPVYKVAVAASQGRGQGMMDGRGPYWQHPEVTQEQQAAIEKALTEYRSKMQPLQNDLGAKQTELNYMARGNDTDQATVSKMIADIKSLREKCQTLHENTATSLAKSANISPEHAHALLGMRGGMGGGMGMTGGGMGRHHMGSYGSHGMGWGGHQPCPCY